MKSQTKIWCVLATLILFSSCSQKTNYEDNGDFETRFPIRINEVKTEVQVAIEFRERARGLMHRDSLEENEGMLFVFPVPERQSFWMRNTSIPLDIGFFNENGVLDEILPLIPYNETAVLSNSNRIQFALEMNRGWFRRNELLPGAQLNLDDLRKVIKARGGTPSEWGL